MGAQETPSAREGTLSRLHRPQGFPTLLDRRLGKKLAHFPSNRSVKIPQDNQLSRFRHTLESLPLKKAKVKIKIVKEHSLFPIPFVKNELGMDFDHLISCRVEYMASQQELKTHKEWRLFQTVLFGHG